MPDLFAQFLIDAHEHLELVVSSLLSIDRDAPPFDVGVGLRSAHSMKGAARVVGVEPVLSLIEELEELLGKIGNEQAPDSEAIDVAVALCDRIVYALEDASPDDAAVSDGDESEEIGGEPTGDGPGVEILRAALPDLPEDVIESLTDFQGDELLRHLRAGRSIYFVYVDTTSDAFESDSDEASAYLKQTGEVVGQSIGVSHETEYDYTVTFIFASPSDPLPPDGARYGFRFDALTTGVLPEGGTEAPPVEEVQEPATSSDAQMGDVPDAQLQEIFLASADNLVQELHGAVSAAEADPDSTDVLDALFRAGHSLKGAGASFGFPIVSRLGRDMEAVLDRVRRRQVVVSDALIGVLYECEDTLQEIIHSAQNGALDQDEPLPVLEKLKDVAEGNHQQKEAKPEAEAAAEPESDAMPSSGSLGKSFHLSVDAADRLLDLGRDAWLAAETAAFVSPPSGEIRESVDRTRTAILSLVDAILGTRMQPVGQILRAYPRLIRQVSRSQGKRIQLRISGADVQMDRVMLEAINDPLVHLVRNALDHGIETTEEREKSGKKPEGTLTISASADRDTVRIQVIDDGRGIDTERLRKKAVESGRVTPENARTMTQEQALNLMFIPSLSTKDTVTELSGRGVGMDVVRANVEQLRGRVEIESQKGSGTTISLHLPLTAAMLRVVEVDVDGGRLCIPTTSVDRIVSVEPGSMEVQVGGDSEQAEILPLVPASRYVSGNGARTEASEAVLLREHGRAAGLLVDRVIEERPVLISDLGGLITRTRWVGACTLLADGSVAPILDTSAILASIRDSHDPFIPEDSTPDQPEQRQSSLPRIVAADDSPTMRQLLRNVLELAGYSVRMAEDGRAALALLEEELPDLVLTDVNMPHMNGLEFVREIRKRWRTLPVAIISGRDTDADRAVGLDAGANAYIVKGASDRRGLLQTVMRLLHGEPTK